MTANTQIKLRKALELINSSRFDEAINLLSQIAKTSKESYEIYFYLGVAFDMQGNHVQSEINYHKALSTNPNAIGIYINLGNTQKLMGKFLEAEKSYKAALDKKQNYIDAYYNLIILLLELDRIKEAKIYIDKALSYDKNHSGIILLQGNILLKEDKHADAENIFKKVIQLDPNNTDAHINLGLIYEHIGRFDSAKNYYQSALEISPGLDFSLIGLASILEKEGQILEAYKLLSPHVINSRHNLRLRNIFAKINNRLYRYSDAEAILIKSENIPAPIRDRQDLYFELGNSYDKQKKYKDAFTAFKTANDLHKYSYNHSDTEKEFSNIRNFFRENTLSVNLQTKDYSNIPIFIIGMPRSGTSLVEQILASHSKVFGAGEIEYIDDLISTIKPGNSQSPYPICLKDCEKRTLTDVTKAYLDKTTQISNGESFVTNKMPHNFLHLGLIASLFPKAKIIHCNRTPQDICLSIYFHHFNENHSYSTDLNDLQHYYKQYESLMLYWKDSLDIEVFDINYEDLILSPEEQSRKLINYCDLKWENNCLEFYKSKRIVNTPSYHQVRRPIYDDAINRYKNFNNQLTKILHHPFE